jgi:hypothetical protein
MTLDAISKRLPPGWTAERWSGLVVISAAFDSITIDFVHREFRYGTVVTGSPANTAKYTGRGWRERLLDDAVVALRGAP